MAKLTETENSQRTLYPWYRFCQIGHPNFKKGTLKVVKKTRILCFETDRAAVVLMSSK
jgi:hypothetical protein